MRSKIYYLFFLLCFISIYSDILEAQHQSGNQPVTLHRSEVVEIKSSINGQTYPIKIALPGSYYTSDKTYPVVYLLDAYSSFGIMTEMARLLASDKSIPELIIVGISSEGSSKEFIYNRSRDYTPTQISQEKLPEIYQSSIPASGGAEKFFEFIKEELIPFAESKYRTDSSDRTLAGHSLGGLYVFYSLFRQPDLFKRYVAISPALSWDDGFILKQEINFFEREKILGAIIYTAVGSLENEVFVEPWNQLVNKMKERNYAGLELNTETGINETHYSIIPFIVTHGLRSVFAGNMRAK